MGGTGKWPPRQSLLADPLRKGAADPGETQLAEDFHGSESGSYGGYIVRNVGPRTQPVSARGAPPTRRGSGRGDPGPISISSSGRRQKYREGNVAADRTPRSNTGVRRSGTSQAGGQRGASSEPPSRRVCGMSVMPCADYAMIPVLPQSFCSPSHSALEPTRQSSPWITRRCWLRSHIRILTGSSWSGPGFRSNRNRVSAGDFGDWKRQSKAFEDLNASNSDDFNIATRDRPEFVREAWTPRPATTECWDSLFSWAAISSPRKESQAMSTW